MRNINQCNLQIYQRFIMDLEYLQDGYYIWISLNNTETRELFYTMIITTQSQSETSLLTNSSYLITREIIPDTKSYNPHW